MHRKQEQKGQELRARRVAVLACSFAGCANPHDSRGLCAGHAWQQRTGRELSPLQERRDKCSVDGCGRKHHANGYCSGHCEQARRGAPIAPLRPRGTNEIVLLDGHAEIVLLDSAGSEKARSLIDLSDVPRASGWRWWVSGTAAIPTVRGYRLDDEDRKEASLHRVLLDVDDDVEVDHWDGDHFNNRRHNIRAMEHHKTTQNQVIRSTNTSGYRGVHWVPARELWKASVKHEGEVYVAGHFGTAEQAGSAASDLRDRLFENHHTRPARRGSPCPT